MCVGLLAPCLSRPQQPFFEFSSFRVPAVSLHSASFAPQQLALAPAPPTLATPNLFTVAGPPYHAPAPAPATRHYQGYTPAPAPEPMLMEVVTPAEPAMEELVPSAPTKMTPFVNLGTAEAGLMEAEVMEAEAELDAGLTETEPAVAVEGVEAEAELPRAGGGQVTVTLDDNDIKEIMKAITEHSEGDKHVMTKTDLVQMAVERLKEMEDKMGMGNDAHVYTILSNLSVIEIMEVMENLQRDHLVVLEPVAEGDIIRVSDHPTMDGMKIIEFNEE